MNTKSVHVESIFETIGQTVVVVSLIAGATLLALRMPGCVAHDKTLNTYQKYVEEHENPKTFAEWQGHTEEASE